MPPVPGLLHHALSARSPQAFSPATSSSAFAEPIITFTVRLFYIKPTPQHTAILQDLVAWIVLSLLNFQVLHSFSSFSQPKNIPLSPLKKKKSLSNVDLFPKKLLRKNSEHCSITPSLPLSQYPTSWLLRNYSCKSDLQPLWWWILCGNLTGPLGA